MSEIMQIFLDEYNKTKGQPDNLNLSLIKSGLNYQYKNRIDLYLINDTGIVEYTTYNNERFLDFKEWPVFYEDLQKIRLNNSFVPDEIVNGFSTGTPLKKFVYQPTSRS